MTSCVLHFGGQGFPSKREDKEPAEGAEPALICNGQVVVPDLDVDLVPLLQLQRHSVGSAGLSPCFVVDCDNVLTVFLQSCVQLPCLANYSGEPEVVESFHWGCENSCRQIGTKSKVQTSHQC